jgi:hypothetical protein
VRADHAANIVLRDHLCMLSAAFKPFLGVGVA